MNIRLRSFWTWFFGFIFLYSTYDYLKHLNYENSTFLEHAFDWFLFTSFSILTICGIIYGSYALLGKILKTRHFALDGVGVALALWAHILFTGPLYNQLFWPHDSLNFFFSWTPFFIILGAFYLIRILFYVLVERIEHKQTSQA